jgi:glutaredoxin
MSGKSLTLVLGLLIAGVALAQQPMYRYTDRDGRVVYTDTTPPADARNVQQKKLGGNFIETSEPPYALQVAQQRNPVTLYGGNCGPLCDQSRALLNRRGVPFQNLDPARPEDLAKLRAASGDTQVPVLVIGVAQMIKGFDEERWQAALDSAGYPKTPPVRITSARRESEPPPAKGSVRAGTPETGAGPAPEGKSENRPEQAAEQKK